MYPDIQLAQKDVFINDDEKSILQSKSAPILLCRKKEVNTTGLRSDEIAPGIG
jgi:hydrogenase maturation factor HypF (carbamoyltransferase family)